VVFPREEPVPPPVQVRDVRWPDFDDLRENYLLCYDERDAGVPIGIGLFAERPSLAHEAEWFTAQFRSLVSGEAVGAVAEVGGRAVGSCFVSPRVSGAPSEGSHVGVLGILIHRDHRGRGIGSALLKHVLAKCRGRFEVVLLSVFATNPGAIRLYQRFGFVPCGRFPAAIKRGATHIDEEWMVLRL
jgi:ribosomal protein S18 acetylase RimI-like enzyme